MTVTNFVSYLVEQALLTPTEAREIEASAAESSGLLGRMLLQARVVNIREMSIALRTTHQTGLRIGDQIVELGFATRDEVEAVASRQGGQRLDRYDLVVRSGLIDDDTLLEAALAYIRERDAQRVLVGAS